MRDFPSTFAHDDYADPALAAALAQYDEALRHGSDATTRSQMNAGIETPPPPLQDCLRALNGLWPRREPAAVTVARRIGKFRIERTLGQGGFGVVYLARDESLHRPVALKIPQLHAALSDTLLERFRREGRAAAALDHPHIVPVYEAGTADGVCYIASAYCPGTNLAQWLRQHTAGVEPRLAAQITTCLADAVAYSHSHKVLHRDIKPGNVMLVPREEPAPDDLPFAPRLGDFGLAKLADDLGSEQLTSGADMLTATSMLLGTPAYMAPEQSAGSVHAVGPATDVYSLGVVLYELLTGRPPFQSPRQVDVLRLVCEAEPVPVRQLRPDVPRDLETICLKCLEKDPARRYATAAGLRDDLQRFLRGDSILARPPGRIVAFGRLVRRHPTAATLAVACALGLFAVIGLQTHNNATVSRLNTELRKTVSDLDESNTKLSSALGEATTATRRAQGTIYALDIRNAWHAYKERDLREFTQIIDRYRDGQPLAKYRGLEWGNLAQLARCPGRELLRNPTRLYAIEYSPDNRTCAVVGLDAVVRVLDYRSGQLVAEWATPHVEVNDSLYSPDGDTLWTVGDDGTIRTWDLSTQIERAAPIHAHAGHVLGILLDPKRNLLLSCADEPVIRLWDASTGESRGTLEGHTGTVQNLAWHPDGDHLLSASRDDTARYWDIDQRVTLSVLKEPDGRVSFGSVAPNGKFAALGGPEKMTFWSLPEGDLILSVDALDRCDRVVFDSSGERTFLLTRDGSVHLFENTFDAAGRPRTVQEVRAWQAHLGRAFCIAPNRDGSVVLTAGEDGRLMSWEPPGRDRNPVLTTRHDGDAAIAFHPHTPHLAVADEDGIEVWRYQHEPMAGRSPLVQIAQLDGERWRRVTYSPSGRIVAAYSLNSEVKTWRTDDYTPLAVIPLGESSSRLALSFTHDSRLLAIVRNDVDGVELVRPETGESVGVIPLDDAGAARCSPTDPYILVVDSGRVVRLHHSDTRELIWETPKLPDVVDRIAFSPDGRWIAIGGGDRTISILDVRDGTVLRTLSGHRGEIMDICISPDGRTIASSSADWAVRLWHFSTGQLLWEMTSPDQGDAVPSVVFSADGTWLAVKESLTNIRLLPLH